MPQITPYHSVAHVLPNGAQGRIEFGVAHVAKQPGRPAVFYRMVFAGITYDWCPQNNAARRLLA